MTKGKTAKQNIRPPDKQVRGQLVTSVSLLLRKCCRDTSQPPEGDAITEHLLEYVAVQK
jgi:hypothetical protein